MWWGARKRRKGRLKGSKMSSRGIQNEAKMAPWRPPGRVPGSLWAARGRRGRFLNDLGCLLGGLLGSQNGSKPVLKLNLKSSSASERHVGPLGNVLASILGSFWGRWGLCFGLRRPNTKTLIFDDLLTRNHVFSGPWGSQNQSKVGPESLLALNLAPRASWRPLGLDF